MKRILFVCTGNTCRSPLAEHLLRAKLGDEWSIKSAGIAAVNGQDASAQVYQVLAEEKGISLAHRSQSISHELINWADLVLTMTAFHRQVLQEAFPHKAEQIATLKEYVLGDQVTEEAQDIMDPFGGDVEVYRQTLRELEHLLEVLVDREGERR